MSTRWVVGTPGCLEDVRAAWCSVEGGALVFFDSADRVLVAYAPSAWRTVTFEGEDEAS